MSVILRLMTLKCILQAAQLERLQNICIFTLNKYGAQEYKLLLLTIFIPIILRTIQFYDCFFRIFTGHVNSTEFYYDNSVYIYVCFVIYICISHSFQFPYILLHTCLFIKIFLSMFGTVYRYWYRTFLMRSEFDSHGLG